MKKDIKIPVEKNQYYEMTIDDMGTSGEGIGKIDGYTLFVPGALPGELVKVKIVKTKKKFGFGKLIEIQKPSKERKDSKCSIFERCGGCQLQHLSYEAQLNYKTKKVQDVIERIGGITNITVLPTIGMDDPFFYRNKVQFPVGVNTKGEVNIGFYAMRSHNIIATDKCYIQSSINEQIIAKVKEYIIENKIEPYNELKHRGLVRHIVTRVGYHSKEVMVGIVINGNKLPKQDQLIEKLKTIFNITSIYININKEKTNVILGDKVEVIWGAPYIIDYIGEVKYHISPLSFYQVNPIQTEKLYKKALEYASLNGEETVWDAYCGIGTISLFLARKAKKVYGVEIVEEAIKDARKNAEINNLTNVEFYTGKAEEVITEKYEEGIKADVIVVDPPRKGCDQELLETILKMKPDRVVYVSCDPATLARDISILTENEEYKVTKVQPVDMFPHTTHVETVCLLKRSL